MLWTLNWKQQHQWRSHYVYQLYYSAAPVFEYTSLSVLRILFVCKWSAVVLLAVLAVLISCRAASGGGQTAVRGCRWLDTRELCSLVGRGLRRGGRNASDGSHCHLSRQTAGTYVYIHVTVSDHTAISRGKQLVRASIYVLESLIVMLICAYIQFVMF